MGAAVLAGVAGSCTLLAVLRHWALTGLSCERHHARSLLNTANEPKQMKTPYYLEDYETTIPPLDFA